MTRKLELLRRTALREQNELDVIYLISLGFHSLSPIPHALLHAYFILMSVCRRELIISTIYSIDVYICIYIHVPGLLAHYPQQGREESNVGKFWCGSFTGCSDRGICENSKRVHKEPGKKKEEKKTTPKACWLVSRVSPPVRIM